MWRVIEILKFFQDYSSVSINFLTDKFKVTPRTLQRDIVFINNSLKKISDCKIFKKQDDFLFNDGKKQKAIKTLLAQFIQTTNENTFFKISVLFLSLVWQKNYITSNALTNVISTNMYTLKKDIMCLNSFLDNHNLNIKLDFKINLGFKLIGCEQNLLFITTIIAIHSNKEIPNSLNEKSLTYIYETIKPLIINGGYKNYYNEQLIWFLTIAIRRIKFNYFLTKNMLIKFNVPKIIKKDIDNLLTLMVKQFDIKLEAFEVYYLNLVFLINVRIDNELFPDVILKINKITDDIFLFITNNYQICLYFNIFKQVLTDYLTDNWFKLIFNCDSNIIFSLVDSYDIESKYQWGQQLVLVINSQLKKIQLFPNINILKLQYLAMAFSKSFISNSNWKVSLYIFSVDDSYIRKQIESFINATYEQIIIKLCQNNLDNIFKFHLLNQNFNILIKNKSSYEEYNLVNYKNILIVNICENVWNFQLENNINEVIKLLMMKKIQQLISVFNFYNHEKFYSIKTLLWKFQNAFIKKYNLNLELLDIDHYILVTDYVNNNILLITQLVSFPKHDFPIILMYIKHPLILNKKYPIHFIFILLNNKNNTQNYSWLKFWISLFQNVVNTNIKSIRDINKIIKSVV